MDFWLKYLVWDWCHGQSPSKIKRDTTRGQYSIQWINSMGSLIIVNVPRRIIVNRPIRWITLCYGRYTIPVYITIVISSPIRFLFMKNRIVSFPWNVSARIETLPRDIDLHAVIHTSQAVNFFLNTTNKNYILYLYKLYFNFFSFVFEEYKINFIYFLFFQFTLSQWGKQNMIQQD